MGINDDDNNAILFGEAKWSEKPVGVNILNALKTRAEKVGWGDNKTNKTSCVIFKKRVYQ